MAKRNMDEVLKDYRGNPMRIMNPLVSPPKEEEATLGLICGAACWSACGDGSDNNMVMKQKSDLFNLGDRCLAGGIQDFDLTELAMLKERIAKIFFITTMGPAHRMLETEWIAPVVEVDWNKAQASISAAPEVA